MRPVAILQHDQTQRPGVLLEFLQEMGLQTITILPEEGDTVPSQAKDFSGIVLLGSPHSVHDPLVWIDRELALVHGALAADVPVLGHCFGGQLMAKALGAPVRRNAWPNIGWATLRTTPYANDLFDGLSVPSFNWHYDTFAIPKGAQRTLVGTHCFNKGFRMGRHLAFQCHFEVTKDIIQQWCQEGGKELTCSHGPGVQSAEGILSELEWQLPRLRQVARRVYRQWVIGLPRSPFVSCACS